MIINGIELVLVRQGNDIFKVCIRYDNMFPLGYIHRLSDTNYSWYNDYVESDKDDDYTEYEACEALLTLHLEELQEC